MKLVNLARMTSTTTGTGTLTLGSTVSGCVTFANAGVANGDVVSYGISDGANSEVGWGTYTASGTTLSRDTVLTSTNSGNKISCSGSQQVYITSLAEDIVQKDGWIPIKGTFAYASASTITISAGGATRFAVSDRLKWITATGSTQRYGTVVAVADTLLTVAVNTDHVLANETWTQPYYSHEATPVGYPQWFNYTPTLSVSGGTAPTYTLEFVNRYCKVGRICTVYGKWYNCSGGTAGAGGNDIEITLPFPAYINNMQCGVAAMGNGATFIANLGIWHSGTYFVITDSDWDGITGAQQNNVVREIQFTFTYEVA